MYDRGHCLRASTELSGFLKLSSLTSHAHPSILILPTKIFLARPRTLKHGQLELFGPKIDISVILARFMAMRPN